jgi:hypothetical protein
MELMKVCQMEEWLSILDLGWEHMRMVIRPMGLMKENVRQIVNYAPVVYGPDIQILLSNFFDGSANASLLHSLMRFWT